MIIDKITKQYEQNPLYLNVDWYGELDSEGNFITRKNIYIVDETTENGTRLANIIINNYPLITLVEDEGQLVHVVIEPSLEEIKARKINELDKACNAEILAGFYSDVKFGNRLYGLTSDDQINLEAIKNNVFLGIIPDGTLEYYAKGQPCEPWSNAEFMTLYSQGMAFKSVRIKACKVKKELTRNTITKEEVNLINW